MIGQLLIYDNIILNIARGAELYHLATIMIIIYSTMHTNANSKSFFSDFLSMNIKSDSDF